MALRTFTSTFTYACQHKTNTASKGNRTDVSSTTGIIIIDRNHLLLFVILVLVVLLL